MGVIFNPIEGTFDFTGGAPSGTPDKFAGFDATGAIEAITAWSRNQYFGADIDQTIALTDTTLGSQVFNQTTMTVNPTADIAVDALYGKLTLFNLQGTFDYAGITGHEHFIQQTGTNDITQDLLNTFNRIHLGVGGASTSQNTTVTKSQVRLSGGHVAQTLMADYSEVLMDGLTTAYQAISYNGSTYVGGSAQYAFGTNQFVGIAGELVETMYGAYYNITVDPTATANNGNGIAINFSGDYTGGQNVFNSNFNGDVANLAQEMVFNRQGDSGFYNGINLYYSGTITGNSNDITISHNGEIGDNSQGFAYTRSGQSLQGFNGINFFFDNTAEVFGGFNFIAYTGQATLHSNANGISLVQQGDALKGFTFYNGNTQGDIGDGTGTSLFGLNLQFSGGTIFGGMFGTNISNQNTIDGNNNIYFHNATNSGDGFGIWGFNFYNDGDFDENITGISLFNTGNARTLTGLDMSLSGTLVDDGQGLRINVTGLTTTSTSNHIRSASFEGGLFGVQSQFTPFDSIGIDVGNNIAVTSTIQSGTPLTGTDQIITLIQSNLIVQDDIATGPFGLDTNMAAFVSQIDVASGKTVPLMRSILVGTSVPSGSGGTITEHVVIEMLGLASFGGSVTCPTKIGIQDSQLLGQNFSDGATDAWGIRIRDVNAQNYFAMLAISTGDMKVSNSSVGLEVGSVTKAFLPSRMTTTERDALTALNGMIIYNTTTDTLDYYKAGVWTSL